MSLRNLSAALCHTCGRNLPLKKPPSTTPQKYCSARCRTAKPDAVDRAIETRMLEMAGERELLYRSGKMRIGKGQKGGSGWITCEEVEEAVKKELGSGGELRAADESKPQKATAEDTVNVVSVADSMPVGQSEGADARRPKLDDLRERTRRAARRLAGKELVTLFQNGREIPPSGAAGVMEIRVNSAGGMASRE